jgi:hypothetical protein
VYVALCAQHAGVPWRSDLVIAVGDDADSVGHKIFKKILVKYTKNP